MKSISKIILLGAGILLSLTGCQKENENGGSQGSGKPVQFGAIAGAPGTRTEFSGVVTDGWERINWKERDQVLIWSDNAINRLERPGKSAVYDIINISAQGKESHASIERAGEDGLVFLDEPSAYQFWGIYPASAVSSAPTAGELSYSIPATQTAGDMDNGVLLAYASVPGEQHVDLRFNPAFTAFSFTVAANVSMQINGLTMTSVERKNGANTFGPSVLSGTVAAKVEEGEWKCTVPAASESNTSISTTFTDPLVLTLPEGATKTNEVTFVLFAVPADITSLTMVFNVTVDGKAETRKVTISYAKDDPNGAYAKGDPVSFAGRKKHNIKGLVLPESVNHDVVLDFQVMPWVDSEGTITYGPDAIANAVALEYASGAFRMTGGSRRQNNWFANATDPIVAYFSVFAPEGGSWKIKVSGATDKLTVTASQLPLAGQTTAPTVSSATVDGVLELSGPIGSRVEFKVARANDATASDEIQLNFYAVLDGREISINSEVTRLNALTITGNVGQ
ncbi:MAG: fimbrillin family protein [Prevotella sp.]|nr:fimbrillin family protein [Prevotella sp.]